MNAVDATSRGTEADAIAPPSLLTLILDTNPHAWNLLAPSLPLSKALASLLVFLNAHLAINPANKVAVLASHIERAEWLYPTPDSKASTGGPVDDANKYRPFAALERAINTNLNRLMDITEASSLASSTTTMTAGALTLALAHISKQTTSSTTASHAGTAQSGFNYSDPNSTAGGNDLTSTMAGGGSGQSGTATSRVLIVSTSPDNSAQYIPLMNSIFAAQRLSIAIDVLTLASSSTFLQQAADATGGLYMSLTTPETHAGLLQYLMFAYLPDPSARELLVSPSGNSGVDFRAACFCHRRIVDIGFVCSICLSIFCEPVADGTCLTCGSHLVLANYGQKPAVVPKKKKGKKKRVGGGEGTPSSARGTPVPA